MSIFMHLESVPGQSADNYHKNWIDIYSISWGMARRITAATGTRGGRESSNASLRELTLKKWMDRASPGLFIAACCGRGTTIRIHLSKTGPGSGADSYMEYTLHNALVREYKVAAWRSAQDGPIEKIKISFTKLEKRYIPYDQDGRALAALSVGFDTSTNTIV